MCASQRPVTLLLLLGLLSSATSSPVSLYTPAPPFPSQISPPSPTILPPSPSFSVPPLVGNPEGSTENVSCPLKLSPSALVVRFGDPVRANCSIQKTGYSALGWIVPLSAPEYTTNSFLVWSVDRMNEWSIKPMCYALSDMGGQCHFNLPVTVYKLPDNVSISFVNHTGPMFEGHQYTLQCTVQDVAPVENLSVTFYRGRTALGGLRPNHTTEDNKPVTEIFTLTIVPSKDDDGVQYWCEAKLELGPEGPLHPPVVMSQTFTATVLFGPQLVCPTKLQVREGERLSCEVRGNPQPSVTWFRDGQVVVLPTRSSRKHAGKYTVFAQGQLEQKNFTVEVEVLGNSGSVNSSSRQFLSAILLIQTIFWQ